MRKLAVALLVLIPWGTALAEVPVPEFTSGHELPPTSTPPPEAPVLEYVDVGVLAAALLLAAWLGLKRRSRRGLAALSVFALVYFGFVRKGCVCSIGAIQNVSLAVADSAHAIPLAVAAFFLLPLFATLLFGRVFCASVCPLGALQDVALIRPVKVPAWLRHALGLLPYLYLGAAVVLAALGGPFVICRYDPFVSFFRLSGTARMLMLGGVLLAVAVFVGRPYCRFLCPYSTLLKWLSKLAKWHVTITPDECVQCRLCEDACPFGAIMKPTPAQAAGSRTEGKKLLAALLAVLPVLIGAGGLLGYLVSDRMARSHAVVRTADLVWQAENGKLETIPDEVTAFRQTRRPSGELFDQATQLKRKHNLGGWILGGWVGLVIGGKLIALSRRRTGTDYEADRAECLSCGRCFSYCPRERARLKELSATG